ncbi:serine hydrolase [Actinocorallia sp. A-T 12471]|uniref:serine hydrolase domain-containing protein n=1 Tax=Actinocorallia sp. A-T 12471 TaxID=3089813 RepID=UPI0029CF100C|nr:serine hydrolase [Actinocorallia sp. A-T 12471]MDX6744210.1 serine hydrolase [Actinocorallia sp. A-T 12471]
METPAPARTGRRGVRRALIAVPVALAVLTGAAYATTAIMDVPPPHTLYKVQTTEPSRWGDLFPARTVAAAEEPSPLEPTAWTAPETVPWEGGTIPFEEFLTTTHTNAFIVLRDGKIGYEWYRDGVTDSTPLSSWSMAKSVVSLLVGQAIERGELAEDDRLTDLLPELKTDGDYAKITIRDLLDMASGVDVSENYKVYWPFTGTARMYLTHDLPGFVADHRAVSYTPGSRATYRSVDTQILGLVLTRVTGRPLADLLSDRIWRPLGAEHPATWNLDHPDGTEKAYCCLNATARDYARLGRLILNNGSSATTQIIPPAWITRISTPSPHKITDWGYSAQWWHPSGSTTDFSALGIHGQYLYINPPTRTVIVKLSDHGTEQDEQSTFTAFRSLP